MPETVLVAGGAGYVASYLIEKLAASGFPVFGADVFDAPGDRASVRRSRADNLALRNLARIEELDLSVAYAVDELFLRTNPSVVVNLTPLGLDGTGLAPLLAASKATVKHFVQISCLRAREAGNSWPRVEEAVRGSGIPFTVLRLAEPCGEGLAGTRFPASSMEDIHSGRAIDVEHGPARDYVSPQDAATAILAAIQKGPVAECLEIGTGQARTQGAVVRMLAAAMGRDAVLSVKFGGDFKPPISANLDAARRLLSFHPGSSIEEIVASIVGKKAVREVETVRTRPARPESSEADPDDEPIRLSRRELFGFLRRPGKR